MANLFKDIVPSIKRMTFFLIALLLFNAVSAQVIISGVVSDSVSNTVSNISITYSKLNTAGILGFTQSDATGKFRLEITSSEDSIQLNFNHLTYGKKTMVIPNKTTEDLSVHLSEKPTALKDVVVEASPVYKRSDTVNYNVSAFTDKNDRVIGDIIKKLPGVQMEGDRIMYQGKPIQKYFINGLDLLEGRYGLANNNLPVDAVQNVQVIENDQPVKILDSLIFSDRASLNVKLKKFTTTGTGGIGAGLMPALWDVNLSPMTFNRTFQSINTFQSNNTGNEVSRQLNTLSIGNMFDMMDVTDFIGSVTNSFVNVQAVSAPSFNEKKWLDNHIAMFSSNMLQKLGSGLELKGSLSYINDFTKRTGQTHTTLFTPDHTINITEAIRNSYNVNDLRGSIILLKNEKNIYFKNNLKITKVWNKDVGNLFKDNTMPVLQRRRLENINFSNRFNATTFLGKQLITFNSIINYARTPQSLQITPGQFSGILNDSVAYAVTSQQVGFKSFLTDNYISFTRGFKGIVLMPKIGFSLQKQKLESSINVEDEATKRLGCNYTNDLTYTVTKAYVDLKSQYKTQKFKFNVNTPFRLQRFQQQNKMDTGVPSVTRLTFEPKFTVSYEPGTNWEARATSSYERDFGDINSLYSSYLLTSYRNLQRFNAMFVEGNSLSAGASLHFKNTLKAKFANLSYGYRQYKRNYLYKNTIDENGLNTVELSAMDNSAITHAVSGDANKYFSRIKTVVKISGNASFSASEYLLNEKLSQMKTQSYSTGLNISNSSFDFMSITYATRLSFIQNRITEKKLDDIFMNNHELNLGFFPVENHSFNLNTEYYITNIKSQKDQLFLDLMYRWTIPKKKIDIELSCINLLNNKSYVRLYSSEFSIIRSYFELRPRQLLVSTRFKF